MPEKSRYPISFELTLVKITDVDEKSLWRINLNHKTVQTITKTDAENSEETPQTKDYASVQIARYHVYKEILEKRQEGYQLPNRISMEDLLRIKPTPQDKIEEVNYHLESDHYENFIVIDGDLSIDHLNIDALHGKTDGLIINGDLLVDGGIYNAEGDYGSALVVQGKVVADFLIGGGSEIQTPNKDNYIHSFIFGHYNHGILHSSGSTLVLINSDHNLWLSGKAYYKYDVFDEFDEDEGEFPSFANILSSDFSDLIDDEYFEEDKFIALLTQDKKRALQLIKTILDANFADKTDIALVKKDGLAIKNIIDPSEEIQLAAVKQDGMALEFINNPSEKVMRAAVSNDPYAMEFIQTPSKAIQIAAIKNKSYGDGVALQFIKEPSEELLKQAVSIGNGGAIEYIENPSEELQLLAVKRGEDALESIKNPSDKVLLTAVKAHEESIRYIENPSEELQLIAVQKKGSTIRFIKQRTEAVKLAAVRQAGYCITYIPEPSEALQLEAIKQTGDSYDPAIQYIRNPTEKAQLLAVSFDKDNIKYIQNPTEAVKLAAKK